MIITKFCIIPVIFANNVISNTKYYLAAVALFYHGGTRDVPGPK